MKRMAMSVVGCAALLLTLASCGDDFTSGDSLEVFLRITDIAGSSGGGGQGSGIGTVLHSDVAGDDGIFNDNAKLTFESLEKNPNTAGTNAPFSEVRLERYEVRYFRSDGLNTEGVHVPYRITGPMATSVPFGGKAESSIVIVRHTAKLEPPLLNLVGLHGQELINVIAEITVHGKTLRGDVAKASGRLEITFADFGG